MNDVEFYDPVKLVKICLIYDVIMAKNFKMSDFIKCNGTKCHIIYIYEYIMTKWLTLSIMRKNLSVFSMIT